MTRNCRRECYWHVNDMENDWDLLIEQLWRLVIWAQKIISVYFCFRRTEFSNHLGLKTNCHIFVLIVRLQGIQFLIFSFLPLYIPSMMQILRAKGHVLSVIRKIIPTYTASHPIKHKYSLRIISLQTKGFPLTISLIQRNAVQNSRWLATTSEYRDGKCLFGRNPA